MRFLVISCASLNSSVSLRVVFAKKLLLADARHSFSVVGP